MVTIRGLNEVKTFIDKLPEEYARKVLPGAARAGAKVIAEEARRLCHNSDVKAGIVVVNRTKDDRPRARVEIKGSWERSVAGWLEYGTSPHFVQVDAEAGSGRTAGRVNRLEREGIVVINGQHLRGAVEHPGARPYPFLRPALDNAQAEAIKAAQAYVAKRTSRKGIVGGDE